MRDDMKTAPDSTAVAVIGLAFDFPGCDDWDSLTGILRAGHDRTGPLPAARAEATGTIRSDLDQEGGWIEDITGFDHRYFGLSRAEAQLIDPRQRKMLQLAVAAVGNAGYAPAELRGRDVCVYTAGYGGPEPTLHDLLSEDDRRDGAALTGSIRAFAAGRIAYHLDLRGTALVIDTACSSFLVALHEARWKLVRGEGDMALVGGYELVLGRPPRRPEGADGLGVLSATGRCRPFDEKSDGTTFGEGGGFVLVKRLADAVRDGDTVHAVIRGSAVNQDAGRSNGLTAPSPAGQTQVITAALRDAGVDPATLGYVEAHGTGTRIGDPIEIQGLADALAAFPTGSPPPAALPLSSVKGNFGHLDCMAGFAGLVRVIAQFRAGEIFPTAHFTAPNPLLGLDGGALRIASRCEPWPAGDTPRRAALSSFGLSSTNAHMVLEEGPASGRPLRAPATDRPGEPAEHVVALSARSDEGLRRYATRLRDAVAAAPDCFPLADAAEVLAVGREHPAHFAHRQAWTVHDTAGLLTALDSFLSTPSAGGPAAPVGEGGPRPLVLALGSPTDAYPTPSAAHLRTLAGRYPGFARVRDEALGRLPAERWSPVQRQLLHLAGVRALLADLGVTPDLVLAHGVGAVVARYARGAVELPAALEQAATEARAAAPDAERLEAALAAFTEGAVLLDLAPGSALSALLPDRRAPRVETLTAVSPAELLGVCHRHGFPLDRRTALGRVPRRRVELPLAPFAEEHCWPDTASAPRAVAAEAEGAAPADAAPPVTAGAPTPEAAVLEVAGEVLKEPGIGLDDDFFELGGNSLNGVQLVTRLNALLGTEIEVLDLFDFGSLRDLAASLTTAAPAPARAKAPADAEPEAAEGPLSGQQAAIWAAAQLAPESAAYNVPGAFLFDGPVDADWLTGRLAAVVRRHPMLRVGLRDGHDGPVQVITPPEKARVALERLDADLRPHTVADGREPLLARLKELVDRPLDLYAPNPSRYQLLRARFADGDRYVLVITLHHLFFDGWSWRVLMDDLGGAGDRAAPGKTYLDFVREQREMLAGERGRQLVAFWTERLAGVPTVALPADRADADFREPPGRGADLPLTIEAELATELREIARRERGTLNMVLLAGWMALLWKLGGNRDLAVAGPVTGRVPGHEEVLGCYANTIVVRAALDPGEPFAVLLSAVRDAQLSALSHGDLPADRIIRIARPHSAEPVATTNFGFQNEVEPIRTLGPGGPGVELLDVDPEAPTFALSVSVLEYGDALWARLKYATDLFREETAAAWLAEYRALLARLAELGPGATLFELFGSPPARVGPPAMPDFTF
ncbi:condensation domain-containing protein [Streptomyces sp. NPDC014733]|uniref:condensation domain-containing protein n=1 Tax=Streptomyces sp. NPDC014733 TaxID=3364885 RepID=UPI0036F6ED12